MAGAIFTWENNFLWNCTKRTSRHAGIAHKRHKPPDILGVSDPHLSGQFQLGLRQKLVC